MYHHQDVNDIQYQFYRKPPKMSRGEALRRFLYNSKTKEIFGRTGASWGKFHRKIKNFTLKKVNFRV